MNKEYEQIKKKKINKSKYRIKVVNIKKLSFINDKYDVN